MKILVFIDHMASGGAARVTSVMCRGLAQRGYEVVLAYNRQRESRYECGENVHLMDNSVKRNGTSHWAGICFLWKRIIRFRQIIRDIRPDRVIGVEPEPYWCALLACKGLHIPVIAVDHTSYRREQHWFTHWIRWYAYKWADKVSILSHVDETILGKRLPNKYVIHNPLTFDICRIEKERKKIVLCVAREDAWEIKGMDRMLRMWASLYPRYAEWELWIAGVSPKEPAPNVRFMGQVSDMQTLYQQAAIFALPSRIEGLPMSLLEAASQGCACISFSLGGVAEEIVTDQKSAFIVPDDDEALFTQRLSTLIEQEPLRKQFSTAARKQMNNFSEEHFLDTWEQFLS